MNMKKEVVLPDRLGGEKQITFVPVTKRLCPDDQQEDEEEEEEVSQVDNRFVNQTERPSPTMQFSAPEHSQ